MLVPFDPDRMTLHRAATLKTASVAGANCLKLFVGREQCLRRSTQGGTMLMSGIIEGAAGSAVWSAVVTMCRAITGRQIRITHPRPQETLTEPEPLGEVFCFPVRGTLKHLPANHQIWLLTEDEEAGMIWPQGFSSVQFNRDRGMWEGKICWSAKKQVKITAVVAPRTSQDFFRYYQKVGQQRNYNFEPLTRVPLECTNRASVQARIP